MNTADKRRSFLKTGLLLAGAASGGLRAQNSEPAGNMSETLIEKQYGDPKMDTENLKFDPFEVQRLYGSRKAKFQPRVKKFSEAILEVAQRYVGKSRVNAEADVTRFLNVFNLGFRDKTGEFVPYCAAGVAFVAGVAYAEALNGRGEAPGLSEIQSLLPDIDHHHFFPSPSVLDMYHVAAGKHRWKRRDEVRKVVPGSLVVFDWKKNGGANHVGIVERIEGATVHTIEFNTSIDRGGNQRDGGQIARKARPLDKTIKGFIATNLVTAI